MKQCPVCNELFDDQKAFCDMDGSALVDQTDSLRAALSHANASPSRNSSLWVTGVIGGLIGIIVCVLLYIVFLAPGRQNALDQERRAAETKETRPVTPSQVALVPANNQVPVSQTPSPTETESPAEETASPSPAPATTPAPAALNNGPIATGTTRELAGGDRAIIKMKDGSTVEADAAWEDAQGIWFRRSGLVSFVEKSKVEAITEPQRKPAAAESKTP
jgi:hypothetical protein